MSGFTASREEDVDLSTSLRAGVSLTPKAFGFDENGVGFNVGFRTAGVVTKKSFAYLDLRRQSGASPTRGSTRGRS